jgi:hypothetical protein
VTREHIKVPIPATAQQAVWTDAWDANGKFWSAGTTDGIAIALSVSPELVTPKDVLHRGPTPVLAFKTKELTFQNRTQATYAVTASADKGLLLQARTSEKDLWTSTELRGFHRPLLWFIDDYLAVVDDVNIFLFDEADGKVISRVPLPGKRSGDVEYLPLSHAILVPTAQGAAIYQVQAKQINLINDAALSEAGGRLISGEGNLVVCVSGDRDITLLNLTGNQFKKQWRITLPESAQSVTHVSNHAGVIVIGDKRGSVHLLAQADGRIVRSITHGCPLLDAPMIQAEKLIVADRDGHVTAYHLPGFQAR